MHGNREAASDALKHAVVKCDNKMSSRELSVRKPLQTTNPRRVVNFEGTVNIQTAGAEWMSADKIIMRRPEIMSDRLVNLTNATASSEPYM